jgi:hypothetical protein
MNAKVALNTKDLKPRAKLAKLQQAITKCGEAPALANPSPPLADCQASHDAAEALLNQIETKERELAVLRRQRAPLMATAMSHHAALGACVQSASLGAPAFIVAKGYEVAGDVPPAPPVGRLLELILSHGPHDGTVRASWKYNRSARSTEIQTSPDPMTDDSFVPNQIVTKSSCIIRKQPVGSRLHVRARTHGKDGPGDWSQPASIIVA